MLFREVTPAEARDPQKRQHVDFWNLAHEMERRADVRLALWREAPPPRVPIGSGAIALLGWPSRGAPGWVPVPISKIKRDLELFGSGEAEDVILARKSLPPEVFELLERQYSFRPEVEGQQEGWWFLNNERIPSTAPAGASALALLPARRGALRDGERALLLADIDDTWVPLSERALRVYEPGAALDDQADVEFAQWSGHRSVWGVRVVARLRRASVRAQFGAEAADRARPDARSIVVRCSRRT